MSDEQETFFSHLVELRDRLIRILVAVCIAFVPLAFYASDLYYADLAKDDRSFDDWNANKEGYHAGYFGEVNGEFHKTGPMDRHFLETANGLASSPRPLVTLSLAELPGHVRRRGCGIDGRGPALADGA